MVAVFPLKLCAQYLPQRKPSDHKGKGGKSLILAGSQGMRGAAILTARAALKIGSGYVTLLTNKPDEIALKNPDFLTMDIKHLRITNQAVAIGPGLGVNDKNKKLLRQIIGYEKLVIDADGLTLLAQIPNPKLHAAAILTPHPTELSRLITWSVPRIESNRVQAAMAAAKKYQCLVLLKGQHTVVASPYRAVIVQTGNVALAKAGSGDVLTGIITGLRAQGLSSWQAALVGATVHGFTADEYVKNHDYLTLTASEQITCLGQSVLKLRALALV